MNQEVQKYSVPLRLLHWSTSILVGYIIWLGWYMTGLDDQAPGKWDYYKLHESLGVTLLLLMIFRLYFKWKNPGPGLPAHLSNFNRKAAHTVHFLLYFTLVLMPASGIIMSMSGGYTVPWFFVEIPALLPKNQSVHDVFSFIHHRAWYLVVFFIFLHVAGVLKQIFVDKSNVLRKMI